MTSLVAQWASGVGELHLALSIILFYLINLIGRESVTLGYMSVSMYMQQERSPAFNFALRVISPTVYIIIVASLLYSLSLDAFAKNLYLVIIYYILFRFDYNVLLGQPRLINWTRQVVYSTLMTILGYFTYIKLISIKKNILPDFSNLSNELWVIIILFIYNLINDMNLSEEQDDNRKVKYADFMYNKLSNKYGRIVNGEIKDNLVRFITYAIMMHENFNRPLFARKLENTLFRLTGKPHTLGIMQVYSKVYITDEESVRLGAKRIREAYESAYQSAVINSESDDGTPSDYYLYQAIMQTIGSYNTGEEYSREVYKSLKGLIERHDKELAKIFTID